MKDRKALGDTSDPSSEAWNDLPWKKFERHVFRIQKRIYQASQRGNQRAVQKLQKLLMKSEAARLLAVRDVTRDDQSRQTAGRDEGKSVRPRERLALARQIHPHEWKRTKAQPVRRMSIPEAGKRSAGRPILRERAQQILVKWGLEPEWEARFEPNSYGFRPGRSCHDAIGAIWISINYETKYVLNADLKGCFDHINHEVLLEKLKAYPQMKRIIGNWLKAGVMRDGICEEASGETPQGGAISPLLANIALHGMETLLREAFRPEEHCPILVRYGDDFVVLHHTEEGVLRAKGVLETWLKGMGLAIKPGKARMSHTLHSYQGMSGFDFLGCHVKQFPAGKTHRRAIGEKGRTLDFKTIIRPSKEKVQAHMKEIKDAITRHGSADQQAVIQALNPIIRAWTVYYRTVVAAQEFSACDHKMGKLLWRWAKKRHPKKGADWRRGRYWHKVAQSQWAFMTPGEARLCQHTQTSIQRHVKVKGDASPYDGNLLYWSQRLQNNPILQGKGGSARLTESLLVVQRLP